MGRTGGAFAALALALTTTAAIAAEPEAPRQHAAEVLGDPAYQRELPGQSDANAASTADGPAPARSAGPEAGDASREATAPSPLGPVASFLLWGMLGVAVVLTVAWIAREVTRARRGASASVDVVSDPVAPGRVAAEVVLSEAEALAAAGRFAEAVHALLAAAIRRLATRREVAVDDASTAREVLRGAPLEAAARSALEELVLGVEVSLFGGAPVHEVDFARALAAYRRVEAALA